VKARSAPLMTQHVDKAEEASRHGSDEGLSKPRQLGELWLYGRSSVEMDGTSYFLVRNGDGSTKQLGIQGDGTGFEGAHSGPSGVQLHPLTAANCATLCARLTWLRPVPLGFERRSASGVDWVWQPRDTFRPSGGSVDADRRGRSCSLPVEVQGRADGGFPDLARPRAGASFERQRGELFHTDWTGRGGRTPSGSYQA
jgi:hypothetical protein